MLGWLDSWINGDTDDLAQSQLDVHLGRTIRTKAQGFKHERYSLAQWILIGPIAARHCLVDDADPRSVLGIALGKVPPLHQRNAHRLEVARSRVAVVRAALLAFRGFGRAFDQEDGAAVEYLPLSGID